MFSFFIIMSGIKWNDLINVYIIYIISVLKPRNIIPTGQ